MENNIVKKIELAAEFIGQRIRDLKYDYESKSIFLALETDGSLGIIQNLN